MDKDTLQNILTSIKKWCKDNDISIFNGNVSDNAATQVTWEKTSDTDWETYIAVAKKSETKIIILDVIINDIDTEDEDIVDYRQTLIDEELQKEYEDALKVIKKKKGQVAFFTMSFFNNHVCYGYSHLSEWVEDYSIVCGAFSEENEEDDEYDDNEFSNLRPERLSEEKIEKLARKFISNEKYLAAKNPVQRNEIIETLLKQETIGNPLNSWAVRRKAESIFETEIRPELDEEIRKKVLQLKSTGLKKIEIASKLNISSGMVNKFYYTEN